MPTQRLLAQFMEPLESLIRRKVQDGHAKVLGEVLTSAEEALPSVQRTKRFMRLDATGEREGWD